jgi:sigma-54 dependent transcriptional regulator, acetoin dehydrogenase operon transcriptional activator AcoR
LAERKDFHRIARHLLRIIDPAASITDTALSLLAQRPWPGNVRELRSVLTRLAIIADGAVIGAEHLNGPAPPPASPAASTLERAVIDQVVATWEQSGRNITETARRLGVTRNTIYKKLRLTAGLNHLS